MIRGAIFDLGGVVFDSPLDEIARFEADHGLPPGSVGSVIGSSGSTGAWARLERGELSRDSFVREFEIEAAGHGHRVEASGLLDRVEAVMVARPAVLAAVDRLREGGVVVAALTNNWTPMRETAVAARFDVFVESVAEGVRKPEPEIYRRTLSRMGVEPSRVAMLDDIGANLKTARSLGMATHLVEDHGEAVGWVLGLAGIGMPA